jgi:hypothetical protein
MSENEYLETLRNARKRLVDDRRAVAAVLAKPYNRGLTESMREQIVKLQAAIEAVDSALKDEEIGSGAG